MAEREEVAGGGFRLRGVGNELDAHKPLIEIIRRLLAEEWVSLCLFDSEGEVL